MKKTIIISVSMILILTFTLQIYGSLTYSATYIPGTLLTPEILSGNAVAYDDGEAANPDTCVNILKEDLSIKETSTKDSYTYSWWLWQEYKLEGQTEYQGAQASDQAQSPDFGN